MTDESTWRLTHEQRGRLRRSVDAPALERLLAHLPALERPLMLLSFYSEPSAAEALDALQATGASDAELEKLRPFAEYAPLPPHLTHPENDPDPKWVVPTWPVILRVQPPDDPELRILWEAAEPR